MSRTHYVQRVIAGIGYLDVAEPGWLDKINLDELDMMNGERCILGQLYGSFSYWQTLNPDVAPFRCIYGFELTAGDMIDNIEAGFRNGGYGLLTAAWRGAIEAKREVARASA